LNIRISVAQDFSVAPGPRHINQGKFSGEEFREKILIPKYIEAKESGCKLIIDLDGVFGYFDSFIEEAFGGLARAFPKDNILKVIEFISTEDPFLIEKIEKYIKNATSVTA